MTEPTFDSHVDLIRQQDGLHSGDARMRAWMEGPTGYNRRQRSAALDNLAIAMMQTRPDLEEGSLDEWLSYHRDDLTSEELEAGWAISKLYDTLEN